jgi:hypothetical protein
VNPTSNASAATERRRSACSRTASALLADSTQGTTGGTTAGCSAAGTSATGGSSMITCALVPLIPNEDTPARRGCSPAGHGRASVSRRTAPASQSILVLGASTFSVGGSCPCRIASTSFITPAAPAAAWVCPRFDLTDPSHSGRSSARPWP